MYFYLLLLIVSCYAVDEIPPAEAVPSVNKVPSEVAVPLADAVPSADAVSSANKVPQTATIPPVAVASTKNPNCSQRNGYFPLNGKCDYFIECRGFQPYERMCPDGLHFNPQARWPQYPCGYPSEVSCEGRGAPQPAMSTPDCPHQYGYFLSPLAAPDDCGQYRLCVGGVPFEMLCPPGLAFNEKFGHCDWPELVPGCNVDLFLGFKCPAVARGLNGEILSQIWNFKYEKSCYAFFSCESGSARLLSCGEGLAFSPETGYCVDASLVKC